MTCVLNHMRLQTDKRNFFLNVFAHNNQSVNISRFIFVNRWYWSRFNFFLLFIFNRVNLKLIWFQWIYFVWIFWYKKNSLKKPKVISDVEQRWIEKKNSSSQKVFGMVWWWAKRILVCSREEDDRCSDKFTCVTGHSKCMYVLFE